MLSSVCCLLAEMDIKHHYTRVYKLQTNGKIERFWRTIEDDLLRETYFGKSKVHLKEKILQYLYYYNQERLHQILNGKIPHQFRKNWQQFT